MVGGDLLRQLDPTMDPVIMAADRGVGFTGGRLQLRIELIPEGQSAGCPGKMQVDSPLGDAPPSSVFEARVVFQDSGVNRFYAVRVSCLEDVDTDELVRAPITYFDGRSDNYESPPAETRHL